jgi:ABC-type polysaccharide transport system permease subunit
LLLAGVVQAREMAVAAALEVCSLHRLVLLLGLLTALQLALVEREQQHHQVLVQVAVILFLPELLQQAVVAVVVGLGQVLGQV